MNLWIFSNLKAQPTLYCLACLPLVTPLGCSGVSTNVQPQNGNSISGTVPKIQIAAHAHRLKPSDDALRKLTRIFRNPRSLISVACPSGATAVLYSLDFSGSLTQIPGIRTSIDLSTGAFEFTQLASQGIHILSSANIRYVIHASGCGLVLRRAVTAANQQDLTDTSTLLSLKMDFTELDN